MHKSSGKSKWRKRKGRGGGRPSAKIVGSKPWINPYKPSNQDPYNDGANHPGDGEMDYTWIGNLPGSGTGAPCWSYARDWPAARPGVHFFDMTCGDGPARMAEKLSTGEGNRNCYDGSAVGCDDSCINYPSPEYYPWWGASSSSSTGQAHCGCSPHCGCANEAAYCGEPGLPDCKRYKFQGDPSNAGIGTPREQQRDCSNICAPTAWHSDGFCDAWWTEPWDYSMEGYSGLVKFEESAENGTWDGTGYWGPWMFRSWSANYFCTEFFCDGNQGYSQYSDCTPGYVSAGTNCAQDCPEGGCRCDGWTDDPTYDDHCGVNWSNNGNTSCETCWCEDMPCGCVSSNAFCH